MKEDLKVEICALESWTNIREIYLFGSVARGDNDKNSDVDILIVIDDCDEEAYINYKKTYAEILNMPVSWLSVYRNHKIEKMHSIGSYFLWHIKEEGIKLYSRDNCLEQQLLTLPRYKNACRDLNEYSIILEDIKESVKKPVVSCEYELAVLASLVRNTCIAISYMDGRMDFGRETVVKYCFDTYKIHASIDEYRALYEYRLFNTGKLESVKEAELNMVIYWIVLMDDLLKIGRKRSRDEKEFIC